MSSSSNFNLDECTDRRGTGSLKWDKAGPGELPMWVADMDLRTAPVVRRALARVAREGLLGYTVVTDAYEQAVTDWWTRRHGWPLQRDWLIPTTGVVAAISSIVRSVTNVFEKVVIQQPVYNIFTNSVLNNGRRLVTSDLRQGENGEWRINWADLEAKLADPLATLMILCNPHNPVGRVWTREELARLGTLAAEHHVLVVSDEVHCDLTLPGVGYTPFAAAAPVCAEVGITCLSPSKAFNTAGVHSATVVIPEPHLRSRVERSLNTDEVAEPGAFAVPAVVAAYSAEGEAWLTAVRSYIAANKARVADVVARELAGCAAPVSQATYLSWIDVRPLLRSGAGPAAGRGDALADATTALAVQIREHSGLVLTAGSTYGRAGAGFLRMNLGTQLARVDDGLERLVRGVRNWAAAGH
ncbi:putative C-S lyase [Actinomyces sp. 594]|uniref:MalY/PatB family protein n=1 Tax=Actinomyces sp. 594 TaxID=2057793 RepID=UPI001C567C3C|nr:PatB family C-S lyase [Actinomyces sp. 594]MBW3068158.1 putative C-S lyase [Actinomyces sp. 594]